MRRLKNTILAAAIFVLGCSAPANPTAQAQVSGLKEVKNAGVSLVYNNNDFDEMEIEKLEKQTAQEAGDGVPVGIAPKHFCFNLKDKRPLPAFESGARYFHPAYSFVCAIPLKDSSVENFGAAYPDLNRAALHVQKLLRERPGKFKNRKDVPDIPYNNASPSMLSKFQYLDFRSGSGILFLTQYSQEMQPNPVNNEELTLNFQGVTKNGRYYIAARLAITHPSLPRGIDFTGEIERDKPYRYLRKAEKELEGLPDASFQPSLKSLKSLLASVYVE
jgi:hypothetical protein